MPQIQQLKQNDSVRYVEVEMFSKQPQLTGYSARLSI
jgi:hypothetical protein